jgi:hypothetical protein
VLAKAAKLLFAYSGRGFLMRFVLSTHDEGTFKQLTGEISEFMKVMNAEGVGSEEKGE